MQISLQYVALGALKCAKHSTGFRPLLVSAYLSLCSRQQGYSKEVEYIAAQGPLEPTVCDFWRMIWEHDIHIIVMVTNVMEQGKVWKFPLTPHAPLKKHLTFFNLHTWLCLQSKCAVYWPSKGTGTYGGVEVTMERVSVFPEYTTRVFSIKSVSP